MAKGARGGKDRTGGPRTAAPPARQNRRLAAQRRKLLGKHYASKYRTGGGR